MLHVHFHPTPRSSINQDYSFAKKKNNNQLKFCRLIEKNLCHNIAILPDNGNTTSVWVKVISVKTKKTNKKTAFVHYWESNQQLMALVDLDHNSLILHLIWSWNGRSPENHTTFVPYFANSDRKTKHCLPPPPFCTWAAFPLLCLILWRTHT